MSYLVATNMKYATVKEVKIKELVLSHNIRKLRSSTARGRCGEKSAILAILLVVFGTLGFSPRTDGR